METKKFFFLRCLRRLFFLSFKTKLIRKWQRQWKLVFDLSAVVLGVVFPSKTQNPPLKRKITRVYTINFCFQASNTAQATFCTAVCPLRLGYVYRFIYYVPCDPLVPYPFFFFFLFLTVPSVCWVYISLFRLAETTIYLYRVVFYFVALYTCDFDEGWPDP